MKDCLSEEQLRDLATGAVPDADALSLRSHLEACPSCRELFDEWRENLAFMSTLKESVTDALVLAGAGRGRVCGNGGPERVEGYELREEVHCGAQGVVYRAVRQSTSAEVAIKFMRDGHFASEPSRRRFEREVELVAGLHHPSIIEIHDSGLSATGRQFYVMDFVQGLPLHRYVWDRKLSIDDTLKLFIQVCEAVNYAHQRGVIHRDLKPSNILVGADGVPKVLDFGLARQIVAPPESFVSMTGQVMGTLPYMSPEQTRGDRAEVDIRTDVYSLGVLLYEILTGKYPYPAAGPIPEVLHHIAETPPTPPSRAWTLGSGIVPRLDRPRRKRRSGDCPIDDDLDTIVLRALAKQPERRYHSVAMLMDDLARYLRGQPIEARREAWLYDLHRRLARYKAAVALVCACLIVSVTFGVIAWQTSQNESRERARAVEAQSRLATALMKLGDNALDRGDLQDASGHFLAALAIAEHLAAAELQNLQYQSCRADSFVRLGHVAKERGDLAEAIDYYRRFYTIVRQLAQNDPGNAEYCTRVLLASDLITDAMDRRKQAQSASTSRPAPPPAGEVQR